MAQDALDLEVRRTMFEAAREEGRREGEVNTKLNILIAQNEKFNEQLSLIREALAPVQVTANRALDASSTNQAAILSVAARVGKLEEIGAKAQDVKDLDKRVDAVEVRIAYAAGAAVIAGAGLSYILQQIILLVVK